MPGALHEPDNLAGQLGQHLLGQQLLVPLGEGPLDELVEFHELHDVTLCSGGTELEQLVVGIQFLHGTEIDTAHPDDDDRHGQVRGRDDGVLRGVHVGDDAVGDDEEHLVVGGAVFMQGGNSGHMVDHWREVGRSVELNRVEGVMVGGHHPGDALAVGAA